MGFLKRTFTYEIEAWDFGTGPSDVGYRSQMRRSTLCQLHCISGQGQLACMTFRDYVLPCWGSYNKLHNPSTYTAPRINRCMGDHGHEHVVHAGLRNDSRKGRLRQRGQGRARMLNIPGWSGCSPLHELPLGMFPLILAVLNRDSSSPCYLP